MTSQDFTLQTLLYKIDREVENEFSQIITINSIREFDNGHTIAVKTDDGAEYKFQRDKNWCYGTHNGRDEYFFISSEKKWALQRDISVQNDIIRHIQSKLEQSKARLSSILEEYKKIKENGTV